MQMAEALIALLFAVAVISALAKRVRIPYPILLVIGGLALGFLPFVPRVPLDPNVILLFFLPPLLYSDAFQTSWIEFKRWFRPIALLSTGLVAATTCAVAYVARHFFPELSWPAAFTLGAVLSPTDMIAAHSVIEHLRIPRRMTTILGGEGLVNDATGLVAFQLAVAVAMSGVFEPAQVGVSFLLVALGGAAVGLAAGWAVCWLNRRVTDFGALFAFSLFAPYVAYVVCWHLEVSAVLAVVVAGFYVAWRIHEIDAKNRYQLFAVWPALTFLINGFCFVLLGLEVPHLREGLASIDTDRLWLGGGAVCATVIVVRMVWVWPGAYLPRWLSAKVRRTESAPPARAVAIVGWCGMRGVVSLAAALAIPLELESGKAFPGRDLIIFCTLCTILGTLVLQGLTLEPLIRWLGIKSDELTVSEERRARIELVQTALARIAELRGDSTCAADALERVETSYRDRLAVLESQPELREHLRVADLAALARNVEMQVFAAQKAKLIAMRDAEVINDATQLRLQTELDLEGLRLLH